MDKKEIRRRSEKWKRGELVPSKAMGHCACCNRTGGLRHIDPGPGDVCDTCYIYKPRCKVKGCSEPSVKGGGGKCRNHFLDLGDDDVGLETIIDRRMMAITDF